MSDSTPETPLKGGEENRKSIADELKKRAKDDAAKGGYAVSVDKK